MASVQSGVGLARIMHGHDAASDFAPDISVVIATRGRPRELAVCLEALEKQSFYDFEIVVVDSAPPEADDINREIAKKFNARYVRVQRSGSSRARNQGAREASGRVVAFTDDDALPEPDWLARIYEVMKDEGVAAVVGKTVSIPSNSEAAMIFQRMGGFVNGGKVRLEITNDTRDWFPLVAFHGLGMLANMAVRHSFFLQEKSEGWSGFDERLGRGSVIHGYDENHALLSLVYEGNKVIYSPEILVRHPGPETVEELRKEIRLNRSASTAFFLLLAVRYPRSWRELAKHVVSKLAKAGERKSQIRELSFSMSERIMDRLRGVGWMLLSCFYNG